ncbi:argininosuccinate lyase [Maricaulis maris MCS10]|uniref:Argininosuccinate lyase n=1 Tax=Maricaulis maris (strain MCS10) TaxID=394221 RepID=ARLY_MARMM|nr:argininosuccinate lyase [Maricaulis maris]Q0AM30.1 RecName: Full=Argininosuccinate lyase; Short=ASAL; AltName: Full=Arginosuccinase [Maricaulis maris MCS10]ABI66663.1 argininosuccinate lyase [Maricaulis maris MCS10]
MADDTSNDAGQKASSAMWGGRFSAGPSAVMEAINASIDIDQRMADQDIDGSLAHSRMLAATGVISSADAAAIQRGLEQVRSEIHAGDFPWSKALEDVHMNVEARLKEIIGEPAGRLHTARSRNDQVATDFRLWLRDACDRIDAMLAAYQTALVKQAETHADQVMPGFTHLQTAQPVSLGHHLLSYVEVAQRDRGRFADARKRLNESPLGCAALAGTAFPIDREMTASDLGFDRPMANSLDGVAARDFALEVLSAASICAVNLSRFAEEIVLWCTRRFGFATLSDAWSTGSSIMPQKRNPDAAELVRAKPGRIIGSLTGLLTVVKGLPLAYSKDLQEDKAPVFQAIDDLELALLSMAGMAGDLSFFPEALEEAAGEAYSDATDLADYVVRELGKPFRDAHHISGSIVKLAEARGVPLAELSLAEMQSVEPAIDETVFSVLSARASMMSRTSFGGTSPIRVREQVAIWKDRLGC